MSDYAYADLTQPDDGVLVAKAEPDDMRLWSVTTILKVLAADGLIFWAAEETAKAAVANAALLVQRIELEGADEVTYWLKQARFRRPRDQMSATALGSAAHRCFELYGITGIRPTPDEVRQIIDQHTDANFAGHAAEGAVIGQMLDQFEAGWLDKFQPTYHATEVTVFHPDYGYAGTLDAITEVGGRLLVGDYKTSRKSVDGRGNPTSPYPEVGLQLAGYRHAPLAAVWRPRRFEERSRRYYLLGPDERALAVPTPEVDGGIAIHVTPDHCHVHPVRCDDVIFEFFLHVLEVARWDQQFATASVGNPITTT